jgi:hypothetical protein
MGIKTDVIEKVPQWATTYIMYNDDSGLNGDDKKLVDDFEDKLLKKKLRLICPIDGTENEFEPYPAFGLACDTVDWTAEVLPKTYELEFRETLVAVVQVEAHSRREAIAKANEMLKDGRDGWDSMGQRLHRCKEV